MINNDIILALSDMGDTLTTLKQEAYIFLIALALWVIFKFKKVFVWVYQKLCPPEITRILTEPEPVVQRQLQRSTIASQISVPFSPPNSRINSRKASEADETYAYEYSENERDEIEMKLQQQAVNI